MDQIRKIAVIGGDLRQVSVAEEFAADGHIVKGFGLARGLCGHIGVTDCRDLEDAVLDADIVVLPLPAIKNDGWLNLPHTTADIKIQELLEMITQRQIVLGGMFDKSLIKAAAAGGIRLIDYFDREELTVLNAVPSALPKEGYYETPFKKFYLFLTVFFAKM